MPVAEPCTGLKVALINPPYLPGFSRSQRSPGVIRSGTMYYPYWLAHAAAVLEAEGCDIFLYDCPAAGIDLPELEQRLDRFAPDLCILDTATASIESDCRVAAAIRRRRPETRICVVGTHVTALWQETLRDHPAIDYVAIGEYDYIVRDLAAKIASGDDPSLLPIAGLGFRASDGSPARGPLRPPIDDVDALPWIAPVYARFLDPRHYYFSLARYPMVMLIGGRGCQAKCTYCVYPQVMHGHAYRTRSPASIVGEMKWIQDHMTGVREIVFEDDTFTADREFAQEVARLVRLEGVRLPWFANVRASIDRETLALMAEAGFRCCATGFESGDGLLLKNMWKGQTVEQARDFVAAARSVGVLVHGCFMVGFPGETRESMQSTLDLALELAPDSAQFYPVMPFPGTTYYRWASEHGYLATTRFADWLDSEGGHRCVLNLPGLTADQIEGFCASAYRRFYLRPGYLWQKLRQALHRPGEGIRSLLSLLYYVRFLLRRRAAPPSLPAPPIATTADWRRRHQLSPGRMFRQQRTLERNPSADLASLAEECPDL